MEARQRISPVSRDWKDLYMAAIFEDDRAKILRRIAEAEKAVAERAVELFGAGENTGGNQVREQEAMANAMYFLRLLRKIEGRANVSCEHATQIRQAVQSLGQ